MKENTLSPQKKALIILGAFIAFVTLLSVLWTIFSKPEGKGGGASLDIQYYHDPYSGQTVVKSSATPELYGKTTSITFLGKPKLLDRGLTYEQVNLCQAVLEKLNSGTDGGRGIREATVDFSTYKQTISHESRDRTISFIIILNRGESKVTMRLRMLSFRHTIAELLDEHGVLLHSIDSLNIRADI